LNRIRTFLVIFVVATFLASFFAGSALWGLSAHRFMSINWGLLLALFVLLMLNGRVADRVADAFSSIGRIRGAAFLSAALFFVLACLLRARHDLWGERFIVSRAIEGGLQFHANAPLGILVNRLFFRAANGLLLLTAPASISLLDAIAGGCFVIAAFPLAGSIAAGGRGDRAAAALLLISNGYVVLFFGSGGNTPLSMLFSLLFIWTSLLHLRRRAPLLVPSALFLAAVLSHISALYFLPSLVYLFALGFGRGGRRGEALNACFVTVGAWIVVEVAAQVVWGVPGPAQNLLNRALASLSITGSGLFVESINGAINTLLLTGPAFFAALVLLGARPDAAATPDRAARPDDGTHSDRETRETAHISREERRFFAALVIPALLLCIAAGWRVEHGLRWYVIASTGPAFAAYTLMRLRAVLGEGGRFRRAAAMLIILGLFHTLPLVLTNAIPDAAERRLLSLPLPTGRSETILGVGAFEKGELETAERWLTAAAGKDSLNDLARYYLGRVYMKQDYYMRAITSYYEAHMLRPGSIQYRFDLSNALIENGWYDEAIDQLEHLTRTYPDSIRFWKRLGYARNHGGRFTEAIEAYERVLMMEPSNEDNVLALVSAVTNRGTELQKEGDVDEARKYYELVIRLYPIGWAAQNNLAALELDLGNIENAYGILEQTLKRHPQAAKLNLNMGLVLEKMGRYEEAYDYVRKSLELDPLSPGIEEHLTRIMNEAKERGEAP